MAKKTLYKTGELVLCEVESNYAIYQELVKIHDIILTNTNEARYIVLNSDGEPLVAHDGDLSALPDHFKGPKTL
jgi:hypothetical protein